ncbi:glyoxalase family protein [Anaeramoeba flamelloides]|uniref:Glyoxalase family protein n=1 Tax=Anaeramoeba flamelloides TaxID=1746091 RepID=A0ABQ8Z2G4_9EUKA|nr:glyoxalase family protein [Anaeramoeba flamelloides]
MSSSSQYEVLHHSEEKETSVFGQNVLGVQHVGITVENLEQSLKFYSEALGGKIFLISSQLAGEDFENILFQKEMTDSLRIKKKLKRLSVADLANFDVLDLAFLQFNNVVIELTRYYNIISNENVGQIPEILPASIPSSQHVSFHISEKIDLNDFIEELESWSKENGIENVQCNRMKGCVINEYQEINCKQLKDIGTEYNSLKIQGNKFGDFSGWFIAYCKGPSGEQLEFNQMFSNSKSIFKSAFNLRKKVKIF